MQAMRYEINELYLKLQLSFTLFDVIKHKNDNLELKSWLKIIFLWVLGYGWGMKCERDDHARWSYI